MLKKVTLPENINFLKESEFDFIDDKINNPLDGVEFTMNWSPVEGGEKNIYYIIDDGSLFVKIKWYGGGQLKRTFKRDRVMDLFKRGVWEPYFGPTKSIKESDFDFIKDHDSLDGITFKIPPDKDETIYKIKDDSLDHRVIVTWDNSELIDDRDSNYSEINQKLKFNLTNSDVERLFQFYFDTDEWDSPLSEKRERVQDYMINNFEDDELLYYMGQRESLETTYNRDVVKKHIKSGSWVICDEKINESENGDFGWIEDTNPKKIDDYYGIVLDFFDWNKKYKGYNYSANDYGSVEWDSTYNEFFFYATPYWDNNGVMNITAVDEQGHEIELHTIPLPKFKYEEQLKEWLKSEYPKIVYKEIQVFADTYQDESSLNELTDLGWVGQTNKDLIKLGSIFTCDEGERFVINHISPTINQLTIKSLDFPKDQEDTTIKSSWTENKFLELLDKGELNYVGEMKDFIEESKDLQWIKDVGINRIDLIKKIKETLANHGVEVEWEKQHLHYSQEVTDGSRGEVFAKFFYDTGDREFFIELIESENGLYGFYVYEYNEKYGSYYINANYNSLGTPRMGDEFWRHVCWTVLNQMDAFPKKDKSGDLSDYLKESKDFDWVEDVTPRMDATLLKPGQKFYDKWGDVIRVLEYLGRDDSEGEVCYEPPCSLLRFRKVKDPSGYIPIPGLPADDPQNTDMIMIPRDFDSHIESGKLKLVSKRTMYESKDFEWAKDLKLSSVDKNKSYVLDVTNLDLSNVETHPRSRISKKEALLDDFLYHLSKLGYDVNSVREENARGVPIKYLYLNNKNYGTYKMVVEFDDQKVDDMTYDGKYEIVDSFKDFYFMVKNGLVNESGDFGWAKEISESNGLDWIRDVEAKGFEKNKSYIVDVRNLKSYTPTSVSPTSEEYTKLTRTDVLDKLKTLGYNVDNISITDADYLYIEPNDEAGYWDDTTWINQTHWVDYDMEHNTPDPTYNGKYEVMDVNDLMSLLDNNMVSESTDFDWVEGTGLGKIDLRDCKPGDILVTRSGKTVEYVGPTEKGNYYDHVVKYNGGHSYGSRTHDGYVFRKNRRDDDEDIIHVLKEHKKTITEAAGISFESREWAKIINGEILKNPNEKERLIIDGYDYPEAFKSFPIDYVVIDFYDKLTGYGQEHSGYDKDGNYVVLLYIQPKVVGGGGGFNLRTVLNHEMKHAWDDYNRISKGLPSIDNTKENRELYNKDFILMLSDKNIRGPIKELLKYYYYLSELEKTAYLENVYDGNLNYEKIIRDISSKDFEPFKERFDLDINWHLMNTAYDIPFLKKFKSPIEFIDYSSEELRSKAVNVIKKINKMKYIHNK